MKPTVHLNPVFGSLFMDLAKLGPNRLLLPQRLNQSMPWCVRNRSGIDFTAKVSAFDLARSAWEPYRIAVQLGMDSWDTFEKKHIEINL